VARRLPPGGVGLVDVGCASGYVLDAARDRGWAAVGVDVSEAALKRAARRGLAMERTIDAAAQS
jgi:predicted TPR repeat methyltransferase